MKNEKDLISFKVTGKDFQADTTSNNWSTRNLYVLSGGIFMVMVDTPKLHCSTLQSKRKTYLMRSIINLVNTILRKNRNKQKRN